MIASANMPDNVIRASGRSMTTRLGWLSGVLLLAAVVVVATHLAEGREVVRLAREASPRWLVAGAALQALTCPSSSRQRWRARSRLRLRSSSTRRASFWPSRMGCALRAR
jgi:hypothetical protein